MYGTTTTPQGAKNPFDEDYEYEGNPFEEIPDVGTVQNHQHQQQLHDPQMAQLAMLEDEDDEPFDVERGGSAQHSTTTQQPQYTPQNMPGVEVLGTPATTSDEASGTGETTEEEQQNYHVWNIAYYSKYFNVDTSEVAMRIVRSLIPFSTKFFTSVENNPDLYGPFWIATTLIFVMAAVSNFAKWWADHEHFSYDFRDVTFGAAAVYGYITILPIALWLACKWLGVKLGLVQIWCIYGYSLFVFIPVSVLCILSFDILRWVFVGVGTLMSLVFLVMNFFPPLLRNNLSEGKKIVGGLSIMAGIAVFELGLGLTFKLYFFNYD